MFIEYLTEMIKMGNVLLSNYNALGQSSFYDAIKGYTNSFTMKN